MMKQDEFVQYVLSGNLQSSASEVPDETEGSALPEGFEGFETAPSKADLEAAKRASFARRLLEGSGFGPAQLLDRAEVILGDDPAAKYLSERVYYWPKTQGRPFQTLLFELGQPGMELLNASVFRKLKSQEILEDALARLVQMTLSGFERGGEKRTAAVMQGKQDETLCVVSVLDDRDRNRDACHLVCLGTKTADASLLETFHIREEARYWEPQLANEHLGLLYKRHFSKLSGDRWQNAFITGEERRLARKLLEVCTESTSERKIQVGVVDLLEEIAKGFGLRRKPGAESRLSAFDLPADHDIGADPERIEKKGGVNPFRGMTLRDERSRLLGYIIYCLDEKRDAADLRKYLAKNNRFHNVLVIYPDGDHAVLELWQGTKKLEGKLRKSGAQFEGEGDVVNLLSRFFVVSRAPISNPTELAQELAYRAKYLRRLALRQLQLEARVGDLRALYEEFKAALIHDQSEDDFAGAFAETIAYGLLAARWILKDDLAQKGERFTRSSARDHFPPSSPFLSGFFDSLLKVEMGSSDTRGKLMWLVEDISDLLDRVDITEVFGPGDPESDEISDPVIHFYEPFLDAFDAQIKKDRGVFFTPRPIVSYIVRSVDAALRTDFGLEDGLADTTTWAEMASSWSNIEIPDGASPDDPFVQILDPAAGTGTFLVEAIDVIHQTMVAKWGAKGSDKDAILKSWCAYVKRHLLPRIHGYELLMAPYAIAHLKIVLKLRETGYRFSHNERAQVYLTNALEWPQNDGQKEFDAFLPSLALEANSVGEIKLNKKFTVVIGNPPYSKLSANLEPEHRKLVDEYRYVNGDRIVERGALALEMNLQDDYVKFFRLAQILLIDSGVGVAGLITNHGYLTTPTLRGMRYSLSKSFKHFFILDLHGHSGKGEKSPDGSPDENVFPIQQGVAIAICIAATHEKDWASVMTADLYGLKAKKLEFLRDSSVADSTWAQTEPSSPLFKFSGDDSTLAAEYESWIRVPDALELTSDGIVTARDGLVVGFSEEELLDRIAAFRDSHGLVADICKSFGISARSAGFKPQESLEALRTESDLSRHVIGIQYRPLDHRYLFYFRGLIQSMRWPVTSQLAIEGNRLLAVTRQVNRPGYEHTLASDRMLEKKTVSHDRNTQVFPVLVTSDGGSLGLEQEVRGNWSNRFCEEWESLVGEDPRNVKYAFTPFFYFYSILHSPTYRLRYFPFLRSDYPRIPLPLDDSLIQKLVTCGQNLVQLHLLKAPGGVGGVEGTYNGPKNPRVGQIGWRKDFVWLDAGKTDAKRGHRASKPGTSGFQGVPEAVWDYHIGGYQVCHKWLKDRKGRTLTDDDITHYQKIVVAINETIRIMKEIDDVIDNHGGWPNAFVTSDAKEAKP